jgi:hypothetical protein
MKNKKRLLAIPLVLALFGLSAASCRDVAVGDCLQSTARPAIVSGPSSASWDVDGSYTLADQTPLDATGKTYGSGSMSMKVRNVAGQTRAGLCIVGGTHRATYSPTNTWVDRWHHVYGIIVETPNARVIGPNLYNLGDGIAFEASTATNWEIVGARADGGTLYPNAYIHDDCVQNDTFQAGKIIDSKFDGCATFLSSRSTHTTADGHANKVQIEGTLVRVASMPGTYTNDGQFTNGEHGGFFKWSAHAVLADDDGTPPDLILRDSMFRSDERAWFGGNEGGFLGLPDHTVCDNVVVVGWDSWQQRDRDSWIQWCGPVNEPDATNPMHQGDDDDIPDLRVGTIADWDTAEATWDAAHPAL